MITWLMRLLLVVQLAFAVGLYFFFAARFQLSGVSAALLSVASVITVRLIIVANNFFLAHRFRSPLPPTCRLDWRASLALFFGEARATLTTSSWSMPFRKFSRRVANRAESLPILLVHGYGCNSGYWQPMSKALQMENMTHYAIDLEPVFGSIDDYTPCIHRAIENLCSETGNARLVIVAHSMGGLAMRAYMRKHGSERLARVITLGTPHHGTALASFGIGINTTQMHWTLSDEEGLSSEWLRELSASEGPETYRLFTSIFSHHDNIISPQTSSWLNGAKNIGLHGIGHVALAFNPTVQAHVIHEIRLATDASTNTESQQHGRLES